jgi:hypothetical protein
MALRERRSLLFFAAGFVLFAVLQVLYNQFYLGAFGSLPQLAGARELALQRTGSDSVWTFHLLGNFAGLFASPSRGLAIYSPVMLFAGFGAVAVWRNPVYRELRPVVVAAGLAVLVQLCWYDWWGAWAYGSRQLLDASVYLALLLIPVMAWLPGKRVAIGVFSLLAAWSFFVQGLGAFASTGIGWNNREVYRVELSGDGGVQTFVDFEAADVASSSEGTTYLGTHYCDIDTVECRSRLWSLRDNPIGFHLQNYDEQRARKRYMSSFNRLWL